MRRTWIAVVPLFALLAACASVGPAPTSRIYASEPTDKDNTATLESGGIKGYIRPLNADRSVETFLGDDNVWVSGGMFTVRFACLTGNQRLDDVHSYPHEETINIAPGYVYWMQCDDSNSHLRISNDTASKMDYQTYGQAIEKVPSEVRDLESPGDDGFRYLYYNDWGNDDDVNFEIYTDHDTRRLVAHLTQYHGSVMYLAGGAFNRGVRTHDAMMKALAPVEYRSDALSCPKLPDYYGKLQELFMARVNRPEKTGRGRIYTDSPPIYRYYLGKGDGATASLFVLDEHDALYDTTQEAIGYLKGCLGNNK